MGACIGVGFGIKGQCTSLTSSDIFGDDFDRKTDRDLTVGNLLGRHCISLRDGGGRGILYGPFIAYILSRIAALHYNRGVKKCSKS